MSQSATKTPAGESSRAGRRETTSHRITSDARALVLERGLDGFTMDELAERVGVSRRTLFNYFPGKDDAVLGGTPRIDEDLLATFSAGDPTRSLVEDLARVVRAVLESNPESRDDMARGRRVMIENPRLIALAHQRLAECVESYMVYVERREGEAFSRTRVDVALAVVLACVHLAMDRFLADGVEDSLPALFATTIDTARDLMS